MLEINGSSPRFLRVRASGLLTSADYRRFGPQFDQEAHSRAIPFPLLLDLRGFVGWTPKAFLEDLRFDLRNRRTFSRIAVVGDRARHRWLTYAAVPVFAARLRYFRAVDLTRAEAWLAQSGR